MYLKIEEDTNLEMEKGKMYKEIKQEKKAEGALTQAKN